MSNKQMSNKIHEYDIYQRIFKFIVSVLKFLEKLPRKYSNQVMSAHVTRSVTSMGANS